MTAPQIVGGLMVVAAVADAIRALGSVAAGELYAAVMPSGVTLPELERIITILDRADLVRERGGVLRWIGPVGAALPM